MGKKTCYDYSSSIAEFFNFLIQGKKYIGSSDDMVWRTSDNELNQTLEDYFPELNKIFAITKNSKKDAVKEDKDILIRSHASRKASNFSNYNIESTNYTTAGGLAALWTTYLQSVLFKYNKLPGNIAPIYILSPDMVNSTAYGSSLQFHISHASPMYTDSEFGAINIILTSLKRFLFPKTRMPENDNYLIAEIPIAKMFNFDVLTVGIKYFFNEMEYKIRSFFGLSTILNETIQLAVDSGHEMDRVSKEIGKQLLFRKGSVKLAYNEFESLEMLELKKDLANYGIDCKQLSQEELYEISGIKTKIGKGGSLWIIEEDGNVNPDIVDILINAIKDNGGRIIDGVISEVLYNKESHELDGLIVRNNLIQENTYIKTNRLFTSLGIKSQYIFDHDIKHLAYVPETTIPGTGYSAYLLVYDEIKNPINSNNSHYTPIKSIITKENQAITLLKSTCGGTIGSYNFCVDHAINSLFYASQIIFSDKRVEIIAARSCSRALNGMNSEKLIEILPGFYAASGFGGKGVTDAAGFAKKYVMPKLLPELEEIYEENYELEAIEQEA